METLQLKLSSPVLRSISERFHVEYDWLSGKGAVVFQPTSPVTILYRNPRSVTWHPDDHVLPGSAVAKDSEEWKRIRANPDYLPTFDYFEKLLRLEGAVR